MTANEAGELGPSDDANVAKHPVALEQFGVTSNMVGDTPSKPCTEGGDHCFCVPAMEQHLVLNHQDMLCCWCEKFSCVSFSSQRVPGHGPYRTRLVRGAGS